MRSLLLFAVVLLIGGGYAAKFADKAVAPNSHAAAASATAQAPREPVSSGRSLTVEAGRSGHFAVQSRVNGVFTDFMVDGVRCGGDGHRVDVQGNIWSGSTSILGYSGVTVWSPAGKCIGRIRLPENCANVTFCGPKRDWLFMCASQSVYMIRTNTQGAGPA